MFSPHGKQKLLLQIKLAEDRGAADPLGAALGALGGGGSRPGSRQQSSRPSTVGSSSSSSSRRRGRSVEGGVANDGGHVISTTRLSSLLNDPGVDGVVMNRVMESTVRYRPDKDAVVLKAFQSKTIPYDFFRHFLREAFLLTFSDDEYAHLTRIFDTSNAGVIDGYSFMIAFIRLGGLRKDLVSEARRREEADYLNRIQAEEARRQEELESKNVVAADFGYDEATKELALKKLTLAAKGYDPGHPSAPSLEAFKASHMSVAVLRDTIRSAFNLRVNAKEIAAILRHFSDKDHGRTTNPLLRPSTTSTGSAAVISDASSAMTRQLDVDCKGFLRHFFRTGIDERDKELREQRELQRLLEKQAAEERERKLHEAENKLSLSVDYDFTAADEASAHEKLKEASVKYDRNAPGCQSLDGFDCESLSPGAFKDLIRRIFNLALTNKELGYVINHYDVSGTGNLVCKPFITNFLRIGQAERHRAHSAQLEKQRRLIEEAERESHEKMRRIIEGGTPVAISSSFSDADIYSAQQKLIEASVYFDSSKPGALISFDPQSLSLLDFKRAIKRTFNLTLNPQEMGWVVSVFDKRSSGKIHCKTFLNELFAMGHEERDRVRLEQLEKNKQGERVIKEREEKAKYDLLNKTDILVDFDFAEKDRDSALAKTLVAATNYDKSHPASMSLEAFECFSLKAQAFKEVVRRTFNLKLSPKETGALIRHFDKTEDGKSEDIECGDFITVFLQMGIAERQKMRRAQLQKQRADDKARADYHEAKLREVTNRTGSAKLQVDMVWADGDMYSAIEKLVAAAEKFDKNHPAAPDISAFDSSVMTPGIFVENIKRCFNLRLSAKELGFCISTYGDPDKMTIHACDFIAKFVIMGKASLHEKHRKFLIKQREATKAAKKQVEDQLQAQFEKAESAVPTGAGAFDDGDVKSALDKMNIAASRFDKHHPSAPSTDVFTGGLMPAGQFRECVKNTFQLRLSPRETAALVDAFPWYEGKNMTGDVDTKAFMVKFIRMGFEARSEFKRIELEKQRAAERGMVEKAERALLAAGIGKTDTDVDFNYSDSDRASIYAKMTAASALFDKNAPGCVSPEAFDAAFLTPHDFRSVIKRVFALTATEKELGVLLDEFSDGSGNLSCKPFMIAFTKLGADERYKFALAQLEKQRHAEHMHKTAHERAVKEAEDKLVVKVAYDFSPEERDSAFQNLTQYAKKYDRNAPGCMSLESFEQKTLNVVQFREALKRTFGMIPTPPELGAIVTFFDKTNCGHIVSREFIIYFLQVGQAERDKDHSLALRQQKKKNEDMKKAEEEARSKNELKVKTRDITYTEKEKAVAMEKLAEAAVKFDPASPGPMGLIAFQAQYLTPAVFREMLKRTFNMRVNDAELAAIIDEFSHDGPSADGKNVDCQLFMVKFTQLGYVQRNQFRLAQLEKNRLGLKEVQEEHARKTKETADKMAEKADYSFSNDDFKSALEKVRKFASTYDRGHPSSPSLAGFQGANMQPFEFKDMVMRCFHVALSGKELGALVKYWDTTETLTIDSQAFLTYFFKICRAEGEKRRKNYIEKIRSLQRARREKEADLDQKKEKEEEKKVQFTADDEVTFLSKIRKAAKAYAFDSAALQEPLQAFKGPALTPLAFRDIFSRVFTSIKFTFPEVGVLLSILDTAGAGSLDGPRFLNWFYKLGRQEGKIMLGEAENLVTIDGLRTAAAAAASGLGTTTNTPATNTEEAFQHKPSLNKAGARAKSAEGGARTRSRSSTRSESANNLVDSESPYTTSETVASIVAGLSEKKRPQSQGDIPKRLHKARSQSSIPADSASQDKKPQMTRSSSAAYFPDSEMHKDECEQTSGAGGDGFVMNFDQALAFFDDVKIFATEPVKPPTTTKKVRATSATCKRSKSKLQAIEVLPKRPSGAELHVVQMPADAIKPKGHTSRSQRGKDKKDEQALPDISSPSPGNILGEIWTSADLLKTAPSSSSNYIEEPEDREGITTRPESSTPELEPTMSPIQRGKNPSPLRSSFEGGPDGSGLGTGTSTGSGTARTPSQTRRQKLVVVNNDATKDSGGAISKSRSNSANLSQSQFFFPTLLPFPIPSGPFRPAGDKS